MQTNGHTSRVRRSIGLPPGWPTGRMGRPLLQRCRRTRGEADARRLGSAPDMLADEAGDVAVALCRRAVRAGAGARDPAAAGHASVTASQGAPRSGLVAA